jgi:hypothetical protein
MPTIEREVFGMHSQFKDQVFNQAGTSYLVLNGDPQAPEYLLVKAINPAREVLRMHRDEVVRNLQNAGPARAERR